MKNYNDYIKRKGCISKIRPGDVLVIAMTNHHFKTIDSFKTEEREYKVVGLNCGHPVIISKETREEMTFVPIYHSAILRIKKSRL